MPKLIKEKGALGRLHIDSHLMGESLVSKKLLRRTEAKEYFRKAAESKDGFEGKEEAKKRAGS